METAASPPPSSPPGSLLRSLTGRIRSGLVQFLQIIGLVRKGSVDQTAQLAQLRLFHTEFRKLISANNSFLETLGDLEHRLIARELTDRAYIKRKLIRAISDINSMVESINMIAGEKYSGLRNVFGTVVAPLAAEIEESAECPVDALVLDLDSITPECAELAGGKMANLSELKNRLELPVPDGFVVTTNGYQAMIEGCQVRSWVQERHLDVASPGNVDRISADLRRCILGLEIPPAVRKAIEDAYDRLSARLGKPARVSVRSSAVGEDSDFSFAGQFLSVLNVQGDGLCPAYLDVAASLYSAEAVHYRLLHSIPGEAALMAVGILEMVDAAVSGVAFSRDPADPDSGAVLIQAVRGLGSLLVEGRTSPETLHVCRKAHGVLSRSAGMQETQIVALSGSGLEELQVEPSLAGPLLTDPEAAQLARWAVALENHFGAPQDIEWAIDQNRRLILLQARPLRFPASAGRREAKAEGFPVLVSGGETACPGAACGPAVLFSEDSDTGSFPEGGILVARRPSPGFVRVMSKAKAIVTDTGSTTGHMASLAREFRIPALLNTGTATTAIEPGMTVTVDAGNRYVYAGEVAVLLENHAESEQAPGGDGQPLPHGLRFLRRAVELVSPLNLTDPGSGAFRPEFCRTLHDIARYVHEKSYQEMFMLGDNVGDLSAHSYRLDVFLPVDLYIIDLGGGLTGARRERSVKPAQVASVPFSALLKGMLNEKIQRYGAKPMDMQGFFSIVMRHAATSPEAEGTFSDPCYAIISDNYLNYTARVGYHFSVVDTYCGLTMNKNYISMLFHGGAADYARRVRRAEAIAAILRHCGFSVKLAHDAVNARLNKASREETVRQLEMIGSLLQFFRQMDAAMGSEQAMEALRDAFIRGDYELSGFGGA